jgi:hypothetical protein
MTVGESRRSKNVLSPLAKGLSLRECELHAHVASVRNVTEAILLGTCLPQ